MITFYLSLWRQWNERGQRWSTRLLGPGRERPTTTGNEQLTCLAVYEVEAAKAAEATAVLVEWLHRERPRSMRVREIYTPTP